MVAGGGRPNSCLGRGPTSRLRRKKRRNMKIKLSYALKIITGPLHSCSSNPSNIGRRCRFNFTLNLEPTSKSTLNYAKRRRWKKSSATLWRSLAAHYITAAVIFQITTGGVSSTLVRTWNPRLRKKVPSTTRREEDEERKRRSFRPQEFIPQWI